MKKPSELIIKRNRAFLEGDFGFIFDTFHSDSNFRRQFTVREEYVAVGKASLAQDFRILSCKILHERVSGNEAEVIFLMKMKAHGVLQQYAELAWLKKEDEEWRYHRGLKVTHDELPDDRETLNFAYFEKLDQSTVF